MTSHGDGRLTVLSRHLRVLSPSPIEESNVYYDFDANLELRSIEVGAEFRPLHAFHERERFIDHPLGERDLEELATVRRWDGTRFVTLPRVPIRVAGTNLTLPAPVPRSTTR